jgi:hypothetical protein
MPVPAGHRTFESENLTAVASGPYTSILLTAGLPLVNRFALVARLRSSCSTAMFRSPPEERRQAYGLSQVRLSPAAQKPIVEAVSGSARIVVVQLLPEV